MKLTGNTIFITGGSSGIGLQLAEELTKRENRVITCGRSADKLARASERLPELVTRQCDISIPEQRGVLVNWIREHHPSCNVLINNAAIVHKTNFLNDPDMVAKAEQEIATNLTGPIALCKLFLPVITATINPMIINVTTGLVYAPRATYPIYNATKAAHAFTQVLRIQAECRSKKCSSPLWIHPSTRAIRRISPSPRNRRLRKCLAVCQKWKDEVRVGGTSILYLLSRAGPVDGVEDD